MTHERFRIVAYTIGFILLIGTTAFIFLTGCKSKAPPPVIVEAGGIVLLEGKPLKKVRLRFIPQSDYSQEYTATGESDDAGEFTLTCHGEAGAAVGENVVLIGESEPPDHLKLSKGRPDEQERLELSKYYESLGGRPLPRKYSNLANSPMIITITPDQKSYKISLTVDR
jgi:hypothetical protein